mgnify:CR=1 FL=1
MLEAELDIELGYFKGDRKNRPLESVYPFIFMDVIHFSLREDCKIKKGVKNTRLYSKVGE